MKKNRIILFLIGALALLVLVAGCKKKENDIVGPGEDIGQVEDNIETDELSKDDIMDAFDRLVEDKDLEGLADFIDKNIGMEILTSIEGDRMVLKLEDLLDKNLDGEEEALMALNSHELLELSNSELFFPEDKIKDIGDKDLKDKVESLYKLNYRLINLEGDYYPIIDYVKFKAYKSYLSDEIKDYIDIMADATERPIALDGGLYISYEELSARIIKVERYLNRYGNGKKTPDILNMYQWWLDMYLLGLPNSPIDDYETGMISEDVFNSYKQTALIKDSATAFIVSKYIGLIDENRGKITDDLLEKASLLIYEALDLVDVSK